MFGDDIEKRVLKTAEHVIETGATVRSAAVVFGVSKSTTHKDLTERLRDIDPTLYSAVAEVLEKNRAERHIRGGMATKNRFLERKSR